MIKQFISVKTIVDSLNLRPLVSTDVNTDIFILKFLNQSMCPGLFCEFQHNSLLRPHGKRFLLRRLKKILSKSNGFFRIISSRKSTTHPNNCYILLPIKLPFCAVLIIGRSLIIRLTNLLVNIIQFSLYLKIFSLGP